MCQKGLPYSKCDSTIEVSLSALECFEFQASPRARRHCHEESSCGHSNKGSPGKPSYQGQKLQYAYTPFNQKG